MPRRLPTISSSVDLVDRQMSTWNTGSDLMRLNGSTRGAWISIPPELAEVLAAALRIGRLSGGAFDIGVGSVVARWGFGARANAPGELCEPTIQVYRLTFWRSTRREGVRASTRRSR